MASSILLRLRSSSLNLATRVRRTTTPLIHKSGNVARLLSLMHSGEIIGIDLGTTNSYVSVLEEHVPMVIENTEGAKATPSIVAFSPTRGLLVGAKHQAGTNQTNTIISCAKRIIGRRYNDPLTQKEMKMVPNHIVESLSGDAWVEANGQTYSPSRIAGFVKATNGDTSLGGQDFDNTLLEYLVSEFRRMESVDLSKDTKALQRLRDAAEKAKIELSSTDETRINLPCITADASGAKHLSITITRSKLEELVNDLVERTKNACTSCLKDAGMSAKDIDEVLLVGGMTQLPKIRKAVTEIFGKCPTEPLNPQEAVAMGAAIQAGILRGDLNHLKVFDVTPRSLSMETYGGIVTRLIERHTALTREIAKSFSTAYDYQSEAVLRVCQSENEVPKDNMKPVDLILMGIPHGSRGVPMIIVTFKFDADGIMNVSAKNMQYGRGQVLRMISSESLCDSEQLLVREEELHVEKEESEFKRQEGVILPHAIDWHAKGYVTPVINQLGFGTCWAIAAVATTESISGIKRGHLVEFSIQQLIDCADIDGSEGGHEYFAFRFMKFHGLCAAKDYPYTGHSQQGCDITKSHLTVVKIDGFQTVPLKALDIIHALTNHPLYAVFTEEFASHPDYDVYRGDLYAGGDKSKELPDDLEFHSVCIVGWGYDETAQQYFLKIKDSKGPVWGENGFLFLQIQINEDLSDIFASVCYPILNN
ncbi:hypothetical protein MKX03_032729 [Papaver bracteatum]|nr:hypothetical protein MKX03_032729 [Papaver bracteatum]